LTEDERDDVRACGLTVPTAVVPNGVDTNEYCEGENPAALAATLPATSSRRYILFLGRLVHQKGPDILCAAFQQIAALLPDVDLVFAGPDYGYEAPLRSQIARLGLGQRVHVLGPVFGAAKLALLRGALCLCQPSRNEGFSMSVLEALACAIPAVVSSECHFPDVQAAGAGFVVAADIEPTAVALLSLLCNAPARQRAARAARNLVIEKYSAQAVAGRLVEQYRAVRGTVAAA
jgi:glycosyltransferase involved in cell wall biosynthesis